MRLFFGALGSVCGSVLASQADSDGFDVVAFTPAGKDYTVERINARLDQGADAVHMFAHLSHDNKVFLFPGQQDSLLVNYRLQETCPQTLCGDQEDLGTRLQITQAKYDALLNDKVENLDYNKFIKFVPLEATGEAPLLLSDLVRQIPNTKRLWIEPACQGPACPVATALATFIAKQKDWPANKVNILSCEYTGKLLAAAKKLVVRAGDEVNFLTGLSVNVHDHAGGWKYQAGKYVEGHEKTALEKAVKDVIYAAENTIDYVFFEANDRVLDEAMRVAKDLDVKVCGRREPYVDIMDSAELAIHLRKRDIAGFATDFPQDMQQWTENGRPVEVVVDDITVATTPAPVEPNGGFRFWPILILLLFAVVGAYYYMKTADEEPQTNEAELGERT